MKTKLKNLIIFLSILGILVIGDIYSYKKNFPNINIIAAEYDCTSIGISQMTQRMNQLTEAMKRCSTNSCLINIKNELLSLTQKLQECGQIAQQKKQELAKEAQTLKWKINYLDASISEKQANIFALNTQISFLNNEINQINYEINRIEKEIKEKKELISYSLRKIYEYDKNNLIFITLAQGEFSDFFNEVFYVENLQQQISESIADLRNNKNNLEAKKKELAQKKAEVETAKIQINQQVEMLSYERQEKNNLLVITEGNEAKYEALMAEIEESARQAYEHIYLIGRKLGGGNVNCLKGAKKVFSWPLGGQITNPYGCVNWELYPQMNCPKGQGWHNGIDIGAGGPVMAAGDGKVVYIGGQNFTCCSNGRRCNGNLFGQYVVIKHHDSLYTLYAHLSSIKVKINTIVKEGQIIGTAGNTGCSYGTHLHFVVGTAWGEEYNLADQNPLCYIK